ncbi:MAG: c-type cytochrome [Nitrospirae bacterium]|nr:c-type cytochrome [Nitrospirota bacterium]
MRLTTKQRTVHLIFTATLVVFTVWAIYSEAVSSRPWKKYQREFKKIELKDTADRLNNLELEKQKIKDSDGLKKIDRNIELLKLRLAKAESGSPKIIQNWLLEFNNEADRCVTCHMAVDKPGFEKQANPYKTHPGNYLEKHPVQTFGCVNCHDGEGHALTVEQAHGHGENWLKPLLSGSYAQSKCVKCHSLGQELPRDIVMPGGEKVVKGWRLYMEKNCLGCHVNSLYERPKRIAPVLTKVGRKVNKEWIKRWINKPKDYLPKTNMPDFSLEDEEVELISTYLLSLAGGEKINEPKALQRLNDKLAIESGKSLVNKLGCTGCHTINGKGGDFAPDLSGIAGKTYPEFLYFWLKDPKAHQPDAPMPDLRIPEEEIQDIVAYLFTLKKDKEKTTYAWDIDFAPEVIKKGKDLLKDKGCTGCHEIEDLPQGFNAPPHDGVASKRPEELIWTNMEDFNEKSLKNWLTIKVMDPKKFSSKQQNIITRMPKFDFTEEEAEALVTFILSLTKENFPKRHLRTLADAGSVEMKGRKLLEDRNCLGCHTINKKGGSVAPDLTDEGRKVRPEWLFSFITQPYRIRPLQEARMPYFKLSGDEITTMIEYLAFVSGETYPYIYADKKVTYEEDIAAGKELYQKELACLGCHTFEGKGGLVGPEHTDLASRLRREWIESWLENPQAIQPDVKMPRFKFKDKEKEYLVDYLMTMGRERFLAVQ